MCGTPTRVEMPMKSYKTDECYHLKKNMDTIFAYDFVVGIHSYYVRTLYILYNIHRQNMFNVYIYNGTNGLFIVYA